MNETTLAPCGHSTYGETDHCGEMICENYYAKCINHKPDERSRLARDMKIESGVYDRNRRYEVEKGTRYVQVTHGFHPNSGPGKAVERAIKAAYLEAERKYGDFFYDEVDYTVTILTAQVLVELRLR